LRIWAVQEKLRVAPLEKPWMKHLGKVKGFRKDKKQVEKRIAEAFEQVEREVWE
jgi:hypothetical protein